MADERHLTASAAIDDACKVFNELDSMLAAWFPALGRERQKLAEALHHMAAASAALNAPFGVKPCGRCDAPPGTAHSSSCPAGVAPAAPDCDSNGTAQCQDLPNSRRCAACPLKLGGENCAPGVAGQKP